jgi:tetratricopeptide (TPR) repeat protein
VILSLMTVAAAQAAVPASAEALFTACAAEARSMPEQAVRTAEAWGRSGGAYHADQCLGLAYSQLERWAPAATAFEQAAAKAQSAGDRSVSDFWVQSGNGWLAAGDNAKARQAFDAALATGFLSDGLRGQVHLDRARAAVAAGDTAGAVADIAQGIALVPTDPFAWYLSAALARRQGNLEKARTDILRSVELAPDDANVLLEAGNIAGLSDDLDAAKIYFEKAAKAAPNSDAGRAAAAALAANFSEE